MNNSIHEKLLAPFADDDIEWRLQRVNEEKTSGIAVPYVTNRAIQYRLDDAVGFNCWKNEYLPWHSDGKKAAQICGISIYDDTRGEWVTKYDGAEDSDIEPVKGGLSDSMKRAAVQWGIGRYLYGMETVYINTEVRGKNTYIVKSEFAKLNKKHQEHVTRVFGIKPNAKPEPVQPEPLPKKQEAPVEQANTGPHELPPVNKTPELPVNAVCIEKVVQRPSAVSGVNTVVKVKNHDGKSIEAFVRGTNPALQPGVWLINPSFTQKENQGVIFYTLDKFEITEQAAA